MTTAREPSSFWIKVATGFAVAIVLVAALSKYLSHPDLRKATLWFLVYVAALSGTFLLGRQGRSGFMFPGLIALLLMASANPINALLGDSLSLYCWLSLTGLASFIGVFLIMVSAKAITANRP